MSLTKRSEAYHRWAEDARYGDRRDYDLEYREWQYLHGSKEQTKQATVKPLKPHDNVEQRKEGK